MRWVKCLIRGPGRNEASPDHDQPGEMDELLPDLDPFTVDRILDGEATDTMLSPVLDALSTPALASEVQGVASAVACIAAAIPAPATADVPTRGIRRLTTRTGALAAAGALAFTGVAAAATGVPVPVVQEIFLGDEPVLVEMGDPETRDADEVPSFIDDSDAGSDDDGEKDNEGKGDKAAKVAKVAKEAKERKQNHGAVVSGAAESDCGKADKGNGATKANVEAVEEGAAEAPDLCDADNHGKFVIDFAKKDKADKNGAELEDAADTGKSNIGGDDDGESKGNSSDKASDKASDRASDKANDNAKKGGG